MSQHKDLPSGSQKWANDVDKLMEENKALKEVVRRLCENAGLDFSNPQRGLSSGSTPSTNNPVGQKLSSLADVQIYNVADGQVPAWSQKDQKWLPATLPEIPTGGGGGFFPIPMSYESDIVGFGNITGTTPVWDGTEYVPRPKYSYVGTKDNGVAEMWGSRSVYIGAGDSYDYDRGYSYFEQEFNGGNPYAAIQVVPPYGDIDRGARFVINTNSIFIQYAPLYLERFATVNRPVLAAWNRGGMIYDETLGIPIVWNGAEWTNFIGTPV